MTTTIKLDDDVREDLREYTLPDETASDAVARMMAETEPPRYGIDAAEAERIAERVFDRKARDLR
jgi:thioester reductase-like protein